MESIKEQDPHMRMPNFQHLLYVHYVVTEGGLSKAAQQLGLSPSTLSIQIHALEADLGYRLFERRMGRELVLTDAGRRIAALAEDIYRAGSLVRSFGKERINDHTLTLTVAVSDFIPRLVVQKVLAPLFASNAEVRVRIRDEHFDKIVDGIDSGMVDIALTDTQIPREQEAKKTLEKSYDIPVMFFAPESLWERLKKGFPSSLNGAPFLLPSENTSLRQSIDDWFLACGITPNIRMEFDDSSLMKLFGQTSQVVFPATSIVARDLEINYHIKPFPESTGLVERLFVSLSREAGQDMFVYRSLLERKEL